MLNLRLNVFIAKCKGPLAGLLYNKREITFYVINVELYRGKSLHPSLHNTQFAIHLFQERQQYCPMLQSFPLLGKSEASTCSTQAPHTPGGLFGCIFSLYKWMHLWSGTSLIFTSVTCTNHKTMQNYKICAFSQFSKDLRSVCCIKISQNWNPMVLTLQTIEYIEDSYTIWLILLHFINKNVVWPVIKQS